MKIMFDMDGTIANLYAVESWLIKIRANDPSPYEEAQVMVNMSLLARYLHKAQQAGYKIGIISYVSRIPSPEYDAQVERAKREWLARHLPSITWDEINICHHDIPKSHFMEDDEDILFDDEEENRDEWGNNAFAPEDMFEVLKHLLSRQ